jgi:release factor glutamine methyltransferase
MLTVLEIIKRTTDFLATKGIESPRLNAELLIGHALLRKRMQLYLEFERLLTEAELETIRPLVRRRAQHEFERLLTEAELETIRPLVRRRAQHEPLQYITGEAEFYGLKLKVDRRALIPRPETELLIQQIVAARTGLEFPPRILDLGTGTGAIALALATAYPEASVTATDRSADALELARQNAGANALDQRVAFVLSDWFDAVPSGPYDLIVSNPPYLSSAEVAETRSEVQKFEPREALVSADEGLADLAKIIAAAPQFLTPGGMMALETGIAQHERLQALVHQAGMARVESKRDLTGRDRFIFAYR